MGSCVWVRCDYCAYWVHNPGCIALCDWCWDFAIPDEQRSVAMGSLAHWWSDRQCIARAIQYGQLLPTRLLDDNLIQNISGFLALNAGL